MCDTLDICARLSRSDCKGRGAVVESQARKARLEVTAARPNQPPKQRSRRVAQKRKAPVGTGANAKAFAHDLPALGVAGRAGLWL